MTAARTSETSSPGNVFFAREHLEEHGPEGEDVCPLVDVLTFGLLGAHVSSRSENHTDARPVSRNGRRHRAVDVGRVLDEYLRKAKVQDLDFAVRGELDVGRLQVSMDDPVLVGFLECIGNFRSDGERFVFGDGTTRNPFGERLAFDQRQNEVVRAPRLLQAVTSRPSFPSRAR